MIKNEIIEIVAPVIEDLGYQLWGCEYITASKQALLRIYIDTEKGISLVDCEKVSRQVGAILDVNDIIAGNYSLEVSSPGIPRRLFYKEQYANYIGKQIKLKLRSAIDGHVSLTCKISQVDDVQVTVANMQDGTNYVIPFSNITKANLID
jgi:ribosome maturation factor RimP